MGDAADYAFEQWLESLGQPAKNKKPKNKTITDTWETQRGEHIPINRMQTPHLHSCLRMVRKGWRAEYLPAIIQELTARGESLQ